MTPFRKRTYKNCAQFFADIRFILAHRHALRRIIRDHSIAGAFRERLMLAVTQANQCRHCARVHSKAALGEGLSEEEVRAILGGEFAGCPPGEIPAMLYAARWAESEGQLEAGARKTLVETYGPETAADIDIVLRLIRTGNYTGNTLDYFLYRISFGFLGLPKKKASPQ